MFGREPALWAGALKAVLLCAVLFGLAVSDAQMAGIIFAAEAVMALFVRAQVTPLVGGDPLAITAPPKHLAEDGQGPT
jgi:hypothetical protein